MSTTVQSNHQETKPLTAAQLHAKGELEAAHSQATRWFVVSLILAVLAVLPWPVIWHVASQSSIEPYAIVIDPGGMVLWSGPPGSYDREELWIMTHLQEWIKYVRERREDLVLMHERRTVAQQMTDAQATQALDAYYKAVDLRDPTYVTNPIRVQVGAFRWRPPSAREYDLDWQEKWTPTYGAGSKTLRVSARITIERRQSLDPFGRQALTARDMNQNPMGIIIMAFSWFEEWEIPK